MDTATKRDLDLGTPICRVCLETHKPLNTFKDIVQYGVQKVELREIVQRVAVTLNVQLSDYPTHIQLNRRSHVLNLTRICEDCTDKVFNAYDFLHTLERSEQLISEYLQTIDGPPKSTELAENDSIFPHEVKEDRMTPEDVEATAIITTSIVQKTGQELDENELEVLDEEFQYGEEEHIQDMNDGGGGELGHHQSQQHSEQIKDEHNRLHQVIIPDNDVIEELPDESLVEVTMTAERDDDDGELTGAEVDVEEFLLCDYQQPQLVRQRGRPRRDRRLAIGSRLSTFETSKWHKCEQCKRSFAKIETLENHTRLIHPMPDECIGGDEVSSDIPTIICPYCPRTFQRAENLNRHIMAVHSNTNETPEVENMTGIVEKRVYKRGLCPYCGRSFSQASLAVHIRRHTGDNPYKCTALDCNKAFPRRQDLIIHERQHTGERPHICSICGKSFMRPNKLARHLRIHTGHRPYKCLQCGKCFSQSNDLTIHLRRHSGDKPYRCGICGDGFICGTQLKTHRKQRDHYEPDAPAADPYAKCRVVNRGNGVITNPIEYVEVEDSEMMAAMLEHHIATNDVDEDDDEAIDEQ